MRGQGLLRTIIIQCGGEDSKEMNKKIPGSNKAEN